MSFYGWLSMPAGLIIAIFFVLPVGLLLAKGFSSPSWGFQNFQELIEKPLYVRVLTNTLVISFTATTLCAVIGFPVAYIMVHGRPAIRKILIFVILIPFWTSILVRSFAWLVLLQREGMVNSALRTMGMIDDPLQLINNRIGVLIGMTQILLPFTVFPLQAVMMRIDPSLRQAAGTLGASPRISFLRVYLPLTFPGLATGATLVFIIAIGYFITPALLGGPRDTMIAQLIESQISNFGNWGMASALSMVLLIVTATCVTVVNKLVGVRQVWER